MMMMMMMMMMMIVRNKDNCILNHTAPVPWPSPLTRVVALDSLSPVLSLAVGYGSWQTPLSWSHHLSPHWTNLWARDSAQSSRARVTSSYSHCELSLPSAGDQISGLDHFVDGSEFRTRDLLILTYSLDSRLSAEESRSRPSCLVAPTSIWCSA